MQYTGTDWVRSNQDSINQLRQDIKKTSKKLKKLGQERGYNGVNVERKQEVVKYDMLLVNYIKKSNELEHVKQQNDKLRNNMKHLSKERYLIISKHLQSTLQKLKEQISNKDKVIKQLKSNSEQRQWIQSKYHQQILSKLQSFDCQVKFINEMEHYLQYNRYDRVLDRILDEIQTQPIQTELSSLADPMLSPIESDIFASDYQTEDTQTLLNNYTQHTERLAQLNLQIQEAMKQSRQVLQSPLKKLTDRYNYDFE